MGKLKEEYDGDILPSDLPQGEGKPIGLATGYRKGRKGVQAGCSDGRWHPEFCEKRIIVRHPQPRRMNTGVER